MTSYADLARRLKASLALDTPPVAVTLADALPSGAPRPGEPAPAGCSFWERGARMRVATDAGDHRHCAIGIHTHNLQEAPAAQAGELGEALAAMRGLDYVRDEEVAAIPVLARGAAAVVYAPLADVDAPPDLVLVFAHASQSLVITEALARVDGAVPAAMGRPACALVPQVLNSARSAMSLGCCGARAYLDVMRDEVALWGLPGEGLERYVAEIETLAMANEVLGRFHARRRRDIEAGLTPTVKESLARLEQ